MKATTKFAIVFSFIAFAIFIGLTSASHAKQASKGISITHALGWCCQGGKIVQNTPSQCAQNKGHFFKDKKTATTWCDTQTPGYCCLEGKVLSMKKGDCLKKKGHFFKDKKAASTYCDLHQEGFCCLKGKLSPMTKGDCLKKKGKFSPTRKAARDTCDPLGWCLLKGTVSHLRKSACEKKKGRFFTRKAEANKAARKISASATSHKVKSHKNSVVPGIVPPSLARTTAPFLSVEKLYLKRVKSMLLVCIDIKNRGRGKLTAKDYYNGAVVLQYGKTRWHWPLSKVDKTGNLNRGKSVTYVTGVKLFDPQSIRISFSHVPGRGKSAILMPPPKRYIKGAEKAAKSAMAPGPGMMMPEAKVPISRPFRLDNGIKIRETDETNNSSTTLIGGGAGGDLPVAHMKKQIPLKPVEKMQGTVPSGAGLGESPESVLFSGDYRIVVAEPTSSHKYYQGETISVRYRFLDDVEPGDVTISVNNRGTGVSLVATTVPSPPPHGRRSGKAAWEEVELTLPTDIVTTFEYYVSVSYPAPGMAGFSDVFRVGRNAAGIDFAFPVDDTYHPGGTLPVVYQLTQRVEPGDIVFDLMSMVSITPLATVTRRYTPGSADAEIPMVFSFSFDIPHGVSGDQCFIIAHHPKALGQSHTFAIRAFHDAGGMLEPSDIELISIHRENDARGHVIARVRVTEGFIGDWIEFQVNDNPTLIRELIGSGPREVDIVVDEMPSPVMIFGAENRFCRGKDYTVTVDPANHIAETNEANNSLTERLHYWQHKHFVAFRYGDISPILGEIGIPCMTAAVLRVSSFHFFVKNGGSEPIDIGGIQVRQSGRRSIPGTLRNEDFNEVVVSNKFNSNLSCGERELGSTILPGRCGIVAVRFPDLVIRGDSRLSFSGGPLDEPYTIDLIFE